MAGVRRSVKCEKSQFEGKDTSGAVPKGAPMASQALSWAFDRDRSSADLCNPRLLKAN